MQPVLFVIFTHHLFEDMKIRAKYYRFFAALFYLADTVFPHIVSAKTILFLIWKLQQIQIHSCRNMLRKLFKCGNYMRKYGIYILKIADQINFAAQSILTYLFDVRFIHGHRETFFYRSRSQNIYMQYILNLSKYKCT